jgi:hypothetical protein
MEDPKPDSLLQTQQVLPQIYRTRQNNQYCISYLQQQGTASTHSVEILLIQFSIAAPPKLTENDLERGKGVLDPTRVS